MSNNNNFNKGFEEIRDSFKDLPMTYYPALLIALVKECKKSGAFKKDKITDFVKAQEMRIDHEILSEHQGDKK